MTVMIMIVEVREQETRDSLKWHDNDIAQPEKNSSSFLTNSCINTPQQCIDGQVHKYQIITLIIIIIALCK